ncbi:MAG: hypothetical protein SXV54_00625, partial [Chloroflexota bacterium]|nr:hypothetical protein [Chloroflexota bacterium]
LTVIEAPAPTGSFRPPYCGSDKTVQFNKDQVNASLLANLSLVSMIPDVATVERYFERPWIDHVPNWLAGYLHPEENMPYYGRGMSSQVGNGALMLHLDFPRAQKETLLIRYIQLGIDLYGIVQDDGENNWTPNGGITTGRKWPIIFAGLMLGDEEMKHIGPGDGSGAVLFSEDAQTFYVSQQDIDMTHDPDLRGCYLAEYEQSDLGLPEWGIRHATKPDQDNKPWCAIYRRCCTANSWSGFVLAVHIMGVKELWAHDALFDYQDRYMATEPPYTWTRCWSDFTEEMWDTYRADYGPVWLPLELEGRPADRTIHLSWAITGTLPATSTWRIDYQSQTGTLYTPITGILSPTRAYTLTGLTNYVWYTVTLSGMLGSASFLADTVRVKPTDVFVYLPLVLRGYGP